jgi:outer membrane protein TolC
VLVENELRSGADSSRADVELATARNRLIQARQQAALARVSLSEAIGLGGQVVEIEAGVLLENRPARSVVLPAGQLATKVTGIDTDKKFNAHPLLRLQRSSMDTVNARKLILDRSLFPRIGWQTTLFGRGSGARIDGRRLDNRGYYPDTLNWMTGLTLTFTPSDFFRVRAGRRLEENNLVAAEARFDQARQQLKADEARARAIDEAAEAFSLNAPRQLEAARLTELRARKRYEAELSSITEVAEAQNLLAQAEVEMGIARLSLWRARLAEAHATGNLAPFIALLRKGGSN